MNGRRGLLLSGGGSGGGDIRRQTLTVTANGTYTAPSGVAYTPVIVNVDTPTPPTPPPTPVPSSDGAGMHDVNFLDYDGTIVDGYSKDDFLALTAMPANPSHAGLTAQGWNYTLAQAQDYVSKYGMLDIGQNYITASGDTEIDIEILEGRQDGVLGICPNGTVTINWGDGSPTETASGTSVGVAANKPHTYAPGRYTIKITPSPGTTMSSVGTKNYSTLFHGGYKGADTANAAYNNSVKEIRLGTGFNTIESYAFSMMRSLKAVSCHNVVTNIEGISFYECRNLHGFVAPNSMRSLGVQAFNTCSSLRMVSFGYGLTHIYNSVFTSCHSLLSATLPPTMEVVGEYSFNGLYAMERISIPDGVPVTRAVFALSTGLTSIRIPTTATEIPDSFLEGCASISQVDLPTGLKTIGTTAFKDCRSLSEVTIPSGVTAIKNGTFTNCYSLTKVTLPASVTSIAAYSFSNCYSLAILDLSASDTKLKLENTNAFTGTPNDMKILVKSSLVSAYQNDSFWRTYSSRIVGV